MRLGRGGGARGDGLGAASAFRPQYCVIASEAKQSGTVYAARDCFASLAMTFPCVRPDSPRDGGAGYLDDRQAALLSVAVGPEDRLTFAHADQAGADRGHDRDTAGRDIEIGRAHV